MALIDYRCNPLELTIANNFFGRVPSDRAIRSNLFALPSTSLRMTGQKGFPRCPSRSQKGGLFSAFYVLFYAKPIHCRENHGMTGQKGFPLCPSRSQKGKIVQCFLCLVPCETDSLQKEPWDDRAKRISTLFLTQSELGGLFSDFYALLRAKPIHCRKNHALRIAAKILFVSPRARAIRLKRRAWPSSGNTQIKL